ncbi:unnamed protein product, partial [Natator depressus]
GSELNTQGRAQACWGQTHGRFAGQTHAIQVSLCAGSCVPQQVPEPFCIKRKRDRDSPERETGTAQSERRVQLSHSAELATGFTPRKIFSKERLGACLQCEVCAGVGNSCTGSMQTCAPGQDSCGISLTEVIVEGERTQSFLKGCIPSSECNAGPLSMNFGKGMTARTSIACRTTTVT